MRRAETEGKCEWWDCSKEKATDYHQYTDYCIIHAELDHYGGEQ